MGVDFLLRNAKKIAIFLAIMAIIAATISTFLSFVGVAVGNAVASFQLNLSFVPFFAPSNMNTCIGIVVAVRTARTVYEMSMEFIRTKIDILA